MIDANRGDVVLLQVRLHGREKTSLRPALVVSSEAYHQGRGADVIVAPITGSFNGPLPGDTVLDAWAQEGLLAPSLVSGHLLSVDRSSIVERLGALDESDLRSVESGLRLSLAI